jgi:hypothetical protein
MKGGVVSSALVQMINPHGIIELNIDDIYNPYVMRMYGTIYDQDYYMGLAAMDSDSRYIAC